MTRGGEPAWPILFEPSMRGRWKDLVAYGACAKAAADRSGGRLVYVATPYSKLVLDGDGNWCRVRHAAAILRAAAVCADLARHGVTAVSPIVLAGTMCDAARGLDPLDEKFWNAWCAPLLAACGSIYVPRLTGWAESRGVWTEVCWALAHNKPVSLEAE